MIDQMSMFGRVLGVCRCVEKCLAIGGLELKKWAIRGMGQKLLLLR